MLDGETNVDAAAVNVGTSSSHKHDDTHQHVRVRPMKEGSSV